MTDDSADRDATENEPPTLDRAAIRRLGHDLNNVMTAIQGYTEILLEEVGESNAHRADIELLHTAAMRASAIVRDLMVISR